ncbi:glycosyltransferase family 2 protein [Actinospongicola halichondriae]|uniref:glycosyltransferase family 2 protein n=1 Tax=Actinospongicola halichondriae TaxID=3236844 RepID=UPI003D56629C
MTARRGTDSEIAVVVVNHNTVDLLAQCLESVVAEEPADIVVVDHASTDGSVAMVRERFPDVGLLACDDNPGYGAGVNRGIARTAAAWCLVLNSDTEVAAGCLDALAHHVTTHDDAAVVGPRLFDPDGSVQHSCYPEPTVGQMALQDLGLLPLIARIGPLARRHVHTAAYDEVRSVAWLLGAALCIRREVWESLGGFDERYRMYFEEVDFCRRVRDAGSSVQLAPDAAVVHVGGASTSAYRDELARRYFSSRARYHREHLGRRSLALLRAETALVAAAQWTRERLRLASGSGDAARARTFSLVARDAIRGWSTEQPWTA